MRLDLWASTSPPVRTLKPPLFSTEAKSEGISLCILFVLSKMGVVDAISQSQDASIIRVARVTQDPMPRASRVLRGQGHWKGPRDQGLHELKTRPETVVEGWPKTIR